MSCGCLEGVWRVCEGCLEGVWKVSGRCLMDVLKVFGKCLEDVVRVSGRHLNSVWNESGMKVSRRFLECFRSLPRKGLCFSGRVRPSQNRSIWDRANRDRSSLFC